MYRRINACSMLITIIGMLQSHLSCEDIGLLSMRNRLCLVSTPDPTTLAPVTNQQLYTSNPFPNPPHVFRLRGGQDGSGRETQEAWMGPGETPSGILPEDEEATAEDIAEMESIRDKMRETELKRAGLAFDELTGRHPVDEVDAAFIQAIRSDPSNIGSIKKHVDYLQAKDAQHKLLAEGILRYGLMLNPDDPGAWCRLGEITRPSRAGPASEKALRESEGCFAMALRSQPSHLRSLNAYGQMLLEDFEDVEGGAELFRKGAELDPKSAVFACGLGAVCEAGGDVTGAEELYRRAMVLAPGDVSAVNYCATLLHNNGDVQGARELYEAALGPSVAFLGHGEGPRAASPTGASEATGAGAGASQGDVTAPEGDVTRHARGDVTVWYNYALLLEEEEEFGRAEQALRGRDDDVMEREQVLMRALDENPRDDVLLREYGALYEHRGSLVSAERLYRDALSVELDLARVLTRRCEEEADERALDVIRRRDSRKKKAGKESKAGQNNIATEAEALYARVLASDPANYRAMIGRGGLLAATSQPDHALEALRRAMEAHPHRPEAAWMCGDIHFQQDNVTQGARLYRLAAALDPTDVDIPYNLGCLLMENAMKAEARESWERALAVDEEHVESRFNLALSLHDAKLLDEALSHYAFLLEKSPESAEVRYQIGRVVEEKGDKTEAMKMFKSAMEMDPSMGDAVARYAALGKDVPHERDHARTVLEREAIAAYERNGTTPADANLFFRYAQLLESADGNYKYAAEVYLRALTCQGWPFEALSRCGYLLAKHAGHKAQGRQLLEDALAVDPTHVQTHVRYAQVLLDQQRALDAKRHLEEALRLDPSSSKAAETLRKVETAVLDGHESDSSLDMIGEYVPDGVSFEPYVPEIVETMRSQKEERGGAEDEFAPGAPSPWLPKEPQRDLRPKPGEGQRWMDFGKDTPMVKKHWDSESSGSESEPMD